MCPWGRLSLLLSFTLPRCPQGALLFRVRSTPFGGVRLCMYPANNTCRHVRQKHGSYTSQASGGMTSIETPFQKCFDAVPTPFPCSCFIFCNFLLACPSPSSRSVSFNLHLILSLTVQLGDPGRISHRARGRNQLPH